MYANASVVLILLGFNDGACVFLYLMYCHGVDSYFYERSGIPIEESVANIQSTCQVLANMGKQVWVCPIANWGNDGDKDEARRERNSEFNDQLVDFLVRFV